jgi:GT2 family glycosyltransferase
VLKTSPKVKGTVGLMWGPLEQGFKRDYLAMMEFSRRYICGPDEYLKEVDGSVSWHPIGRNEIAEKAEGLWTFYLDTDHRFQSDVLIRLLNEMELSGADVVSGLYLNKHKASGHAPVALVQDGERLVQLTSWPKGTRHLKVACVGGGCLLVKNSVFKRLRKHYGDGPFDLVSGLSEDYSFCKKCNDIGIDIILCPQVESHHTLQHVLSARDFNFEK